MEPINTELYKALTLPSPIPVRIPSPAESALKQALHQDARTHLGRMFAPKG